MDNNEKRDCPCNNNDMDNRQENDRCMQNEMLMKIKELDFAVVDLGLYLDTHPEDQKASDQQAEAQNHHIGSPAKVHGSAGVRRD